MTIIDSSTTGHSRTEEKKVAKKLYLRLIFVVVGAMIIFLIMGKQNIFSNIPGELNTSGGTPTPISEQPKN